MDSNYRPWRAARHGINYLDKKMSLSHVRDREWEEEANLASMFEDATETLELLA